MDDVHVSIIIPIYNVDKYLPQCLDSIINQTLTEIEIICVDDGSTDNSPQILKEYAQKDNRIKIINKNNGGLGAARNTGLENATGEYIGFVDSDDWIDHTMYEKLYKNAKFHDSDIVLCAMHIYDDKFKQYKYDDPSYTLQYFNNKFDNRAFNHIATKSFFFNINVTSCNKIFKNEFLNEIKARYVEDLIFEDNPFFYYTYLNASKVSLIRNFLYFYRVNRVYSIITSSNKRFMDVLKIHELSRKIFKDSNNFKIYKNDLLSYIINSVFFRYNLIDNEYKEEFYKLIKEYFQDMNLNKDEVNVLNFHAKNKYQSVVNSKSFNEFDELKNENKVKTGHFRPNTEELVYYHDKLSCLQKKQIQNISKIKSLESNLLSEEEKFKDAERQRKENLIILDGLKGDNESLKRQNIHLEALLKSYKSRKVIKIVDRIKNLKIIQ